MHQEKRIAIIGGGPGGLTLARILATRGIPSAVFELDAHALSRPQGGSLDLHTDSAQLALREAGLEAAFRALARYDDQRDAIYDHEGKLYFEHDGTGRGPSAEGGRPEIDRTQLRDILLASLSPDMVRWNSKVSGIEALPDGRYRVVSGSGSLGEFDLVVGADGAWSKVRPLLSQQKPHYTGVTFIELSFEHVDEVHPAIAQLVPSGKISAVGGGQGFIAQRSSGGQVRAYFMFRVPLDWIQSGGLDLSAPDRARSTLKSALPGWAPKFLAFIDECNDAIVARPLVMLPVGHRWEHRAGVTLLGDAAHVMSPFSGEGVNMAMLDACELALALASDDDWSRAVASYEAKMFVRAAEAAAGAEQGLDFVSEQGLAHILEHFSQISDGH